MWKTEVAITLFPTNLPAYSIPPSPPSNVTVEDTTNQPANKQQNTLKANGTQTRDVSQPERDASFLLEFQTPLHM